MNVRVCESAVIVFTPTQFLCRILPHTRTFCTFSIPPPQSPTLWVPWTTFCLFIINALLISPSASWPFILVSMGMTQILGLFGAPWPGPALSDCGSLASTCLDWRWHRLEQLRKARVSKCSVRGSLNLSIWGCPCMAWYLLWPRYVTQPCFDNKMFFFIVFFDVSLHLVQQGRPDSNLLEQITSMSFPATISSCALFCVPRCCCNSEMKSDSAFWEDLHYRIFLTWLRN